MPFPPTTRRALTGSALALSALAACSAPAFAAEWSQTWADEFDAPLIDTSAWDVLTRRNSFNNEQQYYVPQQAAIAQSDGRSVLRITATDEPLDGKAYRSALLESTVSQTYGRFEVVAKIPTTQGIWPAAWLLPRDIDWPLGGEIDIMEHGGSRPGVVSSAYHWNDTAGTSQFRTAEHHAPAGQGWPDAFHAYAVEWDAEAIRYFVDGFNHFTVTPDMLPISSSPMRMILNTAVGGDFDGNPNGSTQFPNHFDIDHVRVFEHTGAPTNRLVGGDFRGGASAWTLTGNTYLEAQSPEDDRWAFGGDGDSALKLYGYGDSKAFQGDVAAEEAGVYTLTASVRVDSDDTIAGTSNLLVMWMEFFNAAGQSIGSEGGVIADATTTQDSWLQRELTGIAPAGTATASVGFEFVQPNGEGGAVRVDEVSFSGAQVPEPGTLAVMFAGGAALLRRRAAVG